MTQHARREHHHEVRFRGRTADGREVVSSPARLQPGSEGASPGPLAEPHWGHAEVRSGEVATMQVSARGHDGARIRFVIEKEENGSWTRLDEVSAVVENGVASASWAVPSLPLRGGSR